MDKVNILVCDDDKEIVDAIEIYLQQEGYHVIKAYDGEQAIEQLEKIIIQGRELGQFVTDFTWYLRNLLLVQSSDDMEEVLDMSAENLALLKEEAKMVEAETLFRYIRIFSELSNSKKSLWCGARRDGWSQPEADIDRDRLNKTVQTADGAG